MTHPLSLAFLTLPDTPPADVVRAAAEAGFAAIGVRLLPAAPSGEGAYPLLTDDSVLAETRAALRDTGLFIADVEITRLNERFSPSDYAGFLERAAALEARHVLVAGDDPDEARLTANFARFCEEAAKYGLTSDLEFMPWTAVPDLASARRIVEAAAQPNGAVLVDALHYDRSATTLQDIADLPPELINYVQFCDGPAVYDPSPEGLIAIARGARLMPGDGGIDLRGLARVIPPEVMISVEVADLRNTRSPLETAQHAARKTRVILDFALAD